MSHYPSRMLVVARVAFGSWVAVEILSWAKVLPITLEFTWLGLIITATGAWLALEIISRWLRNRGAQSLWAGTFIVVLISQCTDAFGDIFRLYGTYAWYDQVAHLVGGSALALVFFNTFYHLEKAGRVKFPLGLHSLVSVFGAMAIGSLYELEEYSEDVIFGSNRMGNAFDTGNDMLMNTLGACLMVLVVWQVVKARRRQ